MSNQSKDPVSEKNLRKQLLYQSTNRGCKETDILLGEFATAKLSTLNSEQLLDYQKILSEDDIDIYNIITENSAIPKHLDRELIVKIIIFHKNKKHDKRQ